MVADKGSVGKGQTGNKNFNVKDPDGHIVEIVEYQPDSWTAKAAGKFLPDTRISDHIMHVGVLVGDLDKSNKFYGEILGFKEFWRGSGSPRMLSWVNMRPAEGNDYLEFMLYNSIPEPGARGTKYHASLTVPDADKALAELKKRAAAVGYDREIAIQTGVNRERQINLYDPDGTRIELMEPNTVDGKPVPSSTAPVPHPTQGTTGYIQAAPRGQSVRRRFLRAFRSFLGVRECEPSPLRYSHSCRSSRGSPSRRRLPRRWWAEL